MFHSYRNIEKTLQDPCQQMRHEHVTFPNLPGNSSPVQVDGEFSFRAPEGPVFSTKYRAGEEGFLAEGDHLPQPPQVTRVTNQLELHSARVPVSSSSSQLEF